MIIANAVEVAPDKQGRILVPSALQTAAGLEGPVLVCGNIDRIELWNPRTYGETVGERADDVAPFAHKLFG